MTEKQYLIKTEIEGRDITYSGISILTKEQIDNYKKKLEEVDSGFEQYIYNDSDEIDISMTSEMLLAELKSPKEITEEETKVLEKFGFVPDYGRFPLVDDFLECYNDQQSGSGEDEED